MAIRIPDSERFVQEFEEKGYAIVRRVFAPEMVEGARRELAKLVDGFAEGLLADGKISDLKKDFPLETRLIELCKMSPESTPRRFRPELHLPGLFDIFFNADLLDCVEMILGPEIRLYPNYTARPKLPNSDVTLVLWHQDGGYTDRQASGDGDVGGLRMVNVWTPLVPTRVENGCMEFVPGTHTLGVVPHERREHYLEIRRDTISSVEDRAVPIELDPGDIVLFNDLLFHRGLPNTSDIVRWSLDWRYQDATQSTLRKLSGHIARSRRSPSDAVRDAEHWAQLQLS